MHFDYNLSKLCSDINICLHVLLISFERCKSGRVLFVHLYICLYILHIRAEVLTLHFVYIFVLFFNWKWCCLSCDLVCTVQIQWFCNLVIFTPY